jgi:hypothetical protein
LPALHKTFSIHLQKAFLHKHLKTCNFQLASFRYSLSSLIYQLLAVKIHVPLLVFNAQTERQLNVAVIGVTWIAKGVFGYTFRAKVCPAFPLSRVLLLALPLSKTAAHVTLSVAGTWGVNVIVSAKQHFRSLGHVHPVKV